MKHADEQQLPNFGKTASDYARHRQGFPEEFFARLQAHDLIKPGLRVLDIGTGTGTIARGLALGKCRVVAIDPAHELLEKARALDQEAGVVVDYRVGTAENTQCADAEFDVVLCGQAWHWFKHDKAIAEVKRVLKAGGKLVIAHFDWLPTRNSVPALTESLILRYNPLWGLGAGTGFYPQWATQLAEADFTDIETYTFDKGVIYTHEQWRGRIRASAGVGASLDANGVAQFDTEHERLLRERFSQDPLTINHRVFTLFATAPVKHRAIESPSESQEIATVSLVPNDVTGMSLKSKL